MSRTAASSRCFDHICAEILARPVCCSTVTPGKLATFCRRPVRRLNSVDFPEFGGPTRATVCREFGLGGGTRGAIEQLSQSLIDLSFQKQVQRGFPTEGDFRTVDSKDTGIATWRRLRRSDGSPGQEAQFHQPLGNGFGQIDAIKDALFAFPQFGQFFRKALVAGKRQLLLETELHEHYQYDPRKTPCQDHRNPLLLRVWRDSAAPGGGQCQLATQCTWKTRHSELAGAW